jgi:hypothetical protein
MTLKISCFELLQATTFSHKKIMNEEEKVLLLPLSALAASPPAMGNQLSECSGRDLN